MGSILLNKTRMEALLVMYDEDEDEYDVYPYLYILSLIKYKDYINDWRITDEIQIYNSIRDISYSILDNYKYLNFITYNKEAHLN